MKGSSYIGAVYSAGKRWGYRWLLPESATPHSTPNSNRVISVQDVGVSLKGVALSPGMCPLYGKVLFCDK